MTSEAETWLRRNARALESESPPRIPTRFSDGSQIEHEGQMCTFWPVSAATVRRRRLVERWALSALGLVAGGSLLFWVIA